MSLSRKATQFAVTKDSNSLVYSPIHVDRYNEHSGELTHDQLVKVITDEMETFRQQKLHDVS